MYWCFAIVNNKLAEIYFGRKRNGQPEIWAHCYLKKEEFKTKREQKWIAQDTKEMKFIYRNKKYYRKTNNALELVYSKKLPEKIRKAKEKIKKGRLLTLAEVKKKWKIS